MYNKKISKKLKMNQTIDLKYIKAREYCDKVELSGTKNKIIDKIYIILFYIGILSTLFILFYMITPQFSFGAYNEQKISIRDKIRLERLEVCQNAYKESGINKQFIYGQIPVVRCATYMGLIYAYESNFGKSTKCIENKNCHGMKGNGIDTPKGFLKFKTFKEGRQYFAKKYFKFHYKKKINQFINNWSMTDRKTYKNFLYKRFGKMYGELEYFYLTGRNKKD